MKYNKSPGEGSFFLETGVRREAHGNFKSPRTACRKPHPPLQDSFVQVNSNAQVNYRYKGYKPEILNPNCDPKPNYHFRF